MHIGKANKSCPDLKVHGTSMQEVQHDVYLGTSFRQNTKSIQNRIGKGIGIISEIMNIIIP